MNLTLNKLPSTTWNRLGMNFASVSLEDGLSSFVPKADYNCAEISWDGEKNEKSCFAGDLTEIVSGASLGTGETSKNIKMETPLVLTYAYKEGEKAASRLKLHAAENSHLKAVLILTGKAEVSALQAEIQADKNAVIDLYLLDLLGEDTLCMNYIGGQEEENASVNLIRLDLGGRKIYSGVNMDLLGNDSSYHSETGYHVKPGQLLDMNYVAVHEGKRTNCLMEVNGTLEEGSRKNFRGTIDFRQGCAGAKATENENVMLMGDELVNQTLPVILCKEEDVEGNHGASIGQLDEKVLFYLASRGISKEAAQALIAQARIDAICEKIPLEEIRSQVREFERVRGITHGEEL